MLLTSIILLVGLLALSLPVAAGIALLAVSLSSLYSAAPLTLAMGEITWSGNSEVIIVCVPLFILMGEILLRTGITERMYDSMVQWLGWLPGGLMHSNIGACALFAATSGSSAATAATISTVALPEMKKYGYNEPLFLGSLAAGGTLGILIPPSINMIVYGVLTQTSIPKLYLAGFIPGAGLAILFMATILVCCIAKPSWRGRSPPSSWRMRIEGLPALVPPLGIFLIVIGSIYAGFATPTESAALGVMASIILAAIKRRLSWLALRQAIEGTMRTTAMILLIIVAAFFLNFVLSAIGLTKTVTEFVTTLGWSPLETLIAIVIFYLILGCFMEAMAMMITTVPIITPVIVSLGYDPIWFGIIMILLVEAAMITPPVGMNLYVVQGVRDKGSLNDVIIGTSPFVVSMGVMIALLIAFPQIAMWLPGFLQ